MLQARRQNVSSTFIRKYYFSLIDFRHAAIRSLLIITAITLLSAFLAYSLRMYVLHNQHAISVALPPDADEADQPERAELLLYEDHTPASLPAILEQAGLQFNPAELRWSADILNIRRFRSGRYIINRSASYPELLRRLLRGEEDAKNIIVHPGQTYERFYSRVSRQFRFDAEELRAVMTDTAYITEELELLPEHFFGRMLPNTYQMYWTSSPEQFLRRMLSEFDRATAPYEERIEQHRFTTDEIVTLASIVELEAMFSNEMPRIAGLYLNRINRRMRLQADPTVNYALGRRGRLTTANYRYEHPYNTYRVNGLPPGAITNPSLNAIRAVIEPEEHNFLFMVATPEGRHAFTRTYAQHRQEVRRWRAWLREQDRLRRELERAEIEP